MAESSSQGTEYEAIEILKAKKGRYYIRWAGIDPQTNKPWKPTWEPKEMANELLVADWREKLRRRSRLSARRNSYRLESISYHSSSSAAQSTSRPTTRMSSDNNRKRSRLSVVVPSISPSSSLEPGRKRRKTEGHQPDNTSDSPTPAPLSSHLRSTDQSSLPGEEQFATCPTSAHKLKRRSIIETQSSDDLDEQSQNPSSPQRMSPKRAKPRKSIPPSSSLYSNVEHSTRRTSESPSSPQDQPDSPLHKNSQPQQDSDSGQLFMPASTNEDIPQPSQQDTQSEHLDDLPSTQQDIAQQSPRDEDSQPEQAADAEHVDQSPPPDHDIPQSQELPTEQLFKDDASHHSTEVEDEYSNLSLAKMANPPSPLAHLDDDPVARRDHSTPKSRKSKLDAVPSRGSSKNKKPKANPKNDAQTAAILAEETDHPSSSSTRPSQQNNEARTPIILVAETPQRTNDARAAAIPAEETDKPPPSPRSPQQSHEFRSKMAELIACLNDDEDPDHQSNISEYISRTHVDLVDKKFILKFVKDPLSYLADPTNEIDQLRKEHSLGDLLGFELERKKTGSICLWFDLNDPAHPKYNFTWEAVAAREKVVSQLFRYPPPGRDATSCTYDSCASEDIGMGSSGSANRTVASQSAVSEETLANSLITQPEPQASTDPAKRQDDNPPNKSRVDRLSEDHCAENPSNKAPVESSSHCPVRELNEEPVERPNENPIRRLDKSVEGPHGGPGSSDKTPAERSNEDPVDGPNEDPVEGPNEHPVESPNEEPVESPEKHPVEKSNEGKIKRSNDHSESMLVPDETRMRSQPLSETERDSPMDLDDTISDVTLGVNSGLLVDSAISQPLQTTVESSVQVSAHDLNGPPSSQNQAQPPIEALHSNNSPSSSVAGSKQSLLSIDMKTITTLRNLLEGALENCTLEYAKRVEVEESKKELIRSFEELKQELTQNFEKSTQELARSFQASLRKEEAKRAEVEESKKELIQSFEELEKGLIQSFQASFRKEKESTTFLESRIRNQDIELTGLHAKIMNFQLEADTSNSKIKSLEKQLVEEKHPARQLYDKFMNRHQQELAETKAELSLAKEMAKRIQRQKDISEEKNDELVRSFSDENQKLRDQLEVAHAKSAIQAAHIKRLQLENQDLSEAGEIQKMTIAELTAAFLESQQLPLEPDSIEDIDQAPGQVSQLERCSLGAQPKTFHQSLRTISSDNEEESQVMRSTGPQSSSEHSKPLSASHHEAVSQHSSSDPHHPRPPPNGQNTFKTIRSSLQFSSSPLCPPRLGTSLTSPSSAATHPRVSLGISSESQKSGTQPSNN